MSEVKAVQPSQVDQFVQRFFDINKKEIVDRLVSYVTKYGEPKRFMSVAKVLAGFYKLSISESSRNKIEKMLGQGWDPKDIEVIYVGFSFDNMYFRICAPNELCSEVYIIVPENKNLTKKEYDIVKQIYNELYIKYLENEINELKEEIEKKRKTINELEEKLMECASDDDEEDDDDDC